MDEVFDPLKARVGDRIVFGTFTGTVKSIAANGYPRVVFDHWAERDRQVHTWPFCTDAGLPAHWHTHRPSTRWLHRRPRTLSTVMSDALLRGDDRGISDVS